MSDNVFTLNTGKEAEQPPHGDASQIVIAILERALQDARAGNLQSLLLLGKHTDGVWSRGISIPPSGEGGARDFCGRLEMIGLLEKVKVELLSENSEQQRVD